MSIMKSFDEKVRKLTSLPPFYMSDILKDSIESGNINGEVIVEWVVDLYEMLSTEYHPRKRTKLIHDAMDISVADWRKQKAETIKIPCKAGCSACCYSQVQVSWDEANLLADHVEKGLPIDIERLGRQAATPDDEGNGVLQWLKIPREDRRCVFLGDDEKCRVYSDRPKTCRKWFIAAPGTPENCADDNYYGPIPFNPQAEVLSTVATGFEDGPPGRLPARVFDVLKRRGYVK